MNKLQFSLSEETNRKSRGLASQTLKGKTVTGTLCTWSKDGSSKTSNGSLGCWLVESGNEHWANLSDIIRLLITIPAEQRPGWFELPDANNRDSLVILLDTPMQLTIKFDANGKPVTVTVPAPIAAQQVQPALV
jgi:hypothetical protein